MGKKLRGLYLECGSTCITKPGMLGKRSEMGDFNAEEGDKRFSSLQRKHTTSTMQIFPTHRQSSSTLAEWWQLHTLIKLSSDFFSADKASPTVAEMERDLRAGFPRQRSDTSCASKLNAMQNWLDPEGLVASERKKKRKRKRKRKRWWCSGRCLGLAVECECRGRSEGV